MRRIPPSAGFVAAPCMPVLVISIHIATWHDFMPLSVSLSPIWQLACMYPRKSRFNVQACQHSVVHNTTSTSRSHCCCPFLRSQFRSHLDQPHIADNLPRTIINSIEFGSRHHPRLVSLPLLTLRSICATLRALTQQAVQVRSLDRVRVFPPIGLCAVTLSDTSC